MAEISTDATTLYLLGHYDFHGHTPKSQGISVAINNGNGWSKPENISIPYFQDKSGALHGSVLNNSVFIFSAETYGTKGVEDIYVSTNIDGKWSGPKNLGAVINTQFQELCPSLSADGKTLYFSSNGRHGYGSFDIYRSTRLDDTWTNWSEPENLGSGINTPGRELFYRTYPALGLAIYTSTNNSDRYGVIKILRDENSKPVVATPPLRVDTVVETPNLKEKKVQVYGKVTNSKTGEPINAKVLFYSPQLNESTASSSKGYAIAIPSTQEYIIKIESPGYVSTMEKLNIQTYEMRELEMNFTMQPVEVGTTINLKSVLFVQTKAELLPESNDELDLVVSFLKANPRVKIELSGHTDNRGVHADNVKLSQQRVNTVKAYLVSKGIEAKRITGKGYGGTKPIATNNSEESRKLNRRVEFTIKRY